MCRAAILSPFFMLFLAPGCILVYATFYKDYLVIRNAQQQACPVPMRHVAGTRA